MNHSKAIEDFWKEFCRKNSDVDPESPYDVWYFGDSRELCELVLKGVKKATASLVWEYEDKPDQAPKLNDYSVVTDFDGNPKCVLQTTEIRVLPFNEVDADFAADEGEGDMSLESWREGHWTYFSRKCVELGKELSLTMPVICERFRMIYPSYFKCSYGASKIRH